MSEKRFIVEYGENNLPFFVDLEEHRDMSIKEVVDLLNEMFEKLNKKQEKSVELFFKYKKLKEENEQLRGINKEIGDDLYNCRLNKNIISEKLKLWQDTLAEYDIYTIKDFEESFELDAKINKEKGI